MADYRGPFSLLFVFAMLAPATTINQTEKGISYGFNPVVRFSHAKIRKTNRA